MYENIKNLIEAENREFQKIYEEYAAIEAAKAVEQELLDKVEKDAKYLTPEGLHAKRRPHEERINECRWQHNRLIDRLEATVKKYRGEAEKLLPTPTINDKNRDLPALIATGALTDKELLALGEQSKDDCLSQRLISAEMAKRSEKGGENADKLRATAAMMKYRSTTDEPLKIFEKLGTAQQLCIRAGQDFDVNSAFYRCGYDECYNKALSAFGDDNEGGETE